MASFLAILLVRGGVHRITDRATLDFDHPAFAVGIGVESLGLVGESLIDGGDFSTDWRVDFCRGFDRLDRGDGLSRCDLFAGKIEGEKPWKYSGPGGNPYRLEHKALTGGEMARMAQAGRLMQMHLQEGRLHERYHRAFLSVSANANGQQENAIDRIGNGPWYDRLGRVVGL